MKMFLQPVFVFFRGEVKYLSVWIITKTNAHAQLDLNEIWL